MLSRDEVAELLEELGSELEVVGVQGHLFLVGGAAMALAYNLKALAARVERDADDLRTLYALSGFASIDEALDHLVGTYPTNRIPPKTEYLLRQVLGDDVRLDDA